jgi:hypothetical protein
MIKTYFLKEIKKMTTIKEKPKPLFKSEKEEKYFLEEYFEDNTPSDAILSDKDYYSFDSKLLNDFDDDEE